MTPPTNRSRSLSVCLSRHTLKFTRSMSGLGLVMIMRSDDDWWWWFWTLSIGLVRTGVSGSLAESESSQIESSQSSFQLHTAAADLPQKPQSITGSTSIALHGWPYSYILFPAFLRKSKWVTEQMTPLCIAVPQSPQSTKLLFTPETESGNSTCGLYT